MEAVLAALTAALLTLFDLDRTFYIPRDVPRRAALRLWWWSFIIANGALAALFYVIVGDSTALQGVQPELRAVVVGISYLALIRAKFTTFDFQGKQVPFGFELFYEAAKGFVYKRINAIARDARIDETTILAEKTSLHDLGTRARLYVDQDALLSVDEKHAAKAWVLKVLQDTQAEDFDKRAALADFLLSGQRSSDFA